MLQPAGRPNTEHAGHRPCAREAKAVELSPSIRADAPASEARAQFGGRMTLPGVSGARISAGGCCGDESILGYIAEFVRPSCRLP